MAIKTLFKTIEEIREHITVDISSDFRTIGPYVKQAEKFTTDIIGADLHAELLTVVHNENTDEKLIALLEKVRLPLANFAYMLAIAKLNVNVGERGFTVTVSGNLTPASQWRVDDFRNSVKESANDALEDLISFLETNKADYPTWTASSAYSFQKKFFINNSKDINESVFIDISRLQFLELKPFIHQIERSVILPTMCEVLFQTLKTEILSGEISPEYNLNKGDSYSSSAGERFDLYELWVFKNANGFTKIETSNNWSTGSGERCEREVNPLYRNVSGDEIFFVEYWQGNDGTWNGAETEDQWTVFKAPNFKQHIDKINAEDLQRWENWLSE